MKKDAYASLKVDRERANWGYSGHDGSRVYLRDVLVEPDGTVRAWDDVGEIYSVHHDLTDEECAEARRLAQLPRRSLAFLVLEGPRTERLSLNKEGEK